jgi:hypothetical protein
MATTFAVPDGRVAMAATLYTGNGTAQTISNAVNTVSFQPDLVWYKSRTVTAYNHGLFDSVRGVNAFLASNLTNAEATYSGVSAFSSNGFSLGTDAGGTASATTYVAWQWKAGGTAVSNTAGTITSTVSANTTAGFSVVTYTGTGVTGTVGHGLGAVPSLIIVKPRSLANNWIVYSPVIGNTGGLLLNLTLAAVTGASYLGWWHNTTPTNASFTIGGTPDANYGDINTSAATYVAYCWAPVAGYSAFGSYTGNGSADGPFIYTGFRPRWIMIKNITNATYGDWQIYDASRSTYNLTALTLQPNSSTTEYDGSGSGIGFDLVSNGVKVRTSNASRNNSGDTFIYAAFAENPLKYSNAR